MVRHINAHSKTINHIKTIKVQVFVRKIHPLFILPNTFQMDEHTTYSRHMYCNIPRVLYLLAKANIVVSLSR